MFLSRNTTTKKLNLKVRMITREMQSTLEDLVIIKNNLLDEEVSYAQYAAVPPPRVDQDRGEGKQNIFPILPPENQSFNQSIRL